MFRERERGDPCFDRMLDVLRNLALPMSAVFGVAMCVYEFHIGLSCDLGFTLQFVSSIENARILDVDAYQSITLASASMNASMSSVVVYLPMETRRAQSASSA